MTNFTLILPVGFTSFYCFISYEDVAMPPKRRRIKHVVSFILTQLSIPSESHTISISFQFTYSITLETPNALTISVRLPAANQINLLFRFNGNFYSSILTTFSYQRALLNVCWKRFQVHFTGRLYSHPGTKVNSAITKDDSKLCC